MINKTIRDLILKSNQKNLPIKGFYTFLNPFSYLLLRKSKILKEFDTIYIDGISLVKILSFFNIKVYRKSFDMTSLANKVFHKSIEEKKKIYFLGAKENEIIQFIKIIKISFSELNICGFRNGYFSSEEEKQAEISNIINKINPEIIIVGMGTPLQEEFLLNLKQKGYKGLAYTCGGFIHQTSKGINYYPKIINKLNLRWMYRILDEPKLVKRYFLLYPKSLFFILTDLIKLKK